MLIGGEPLSLSESESWLYDWTANEWHQKGALHQGRYGHGCISLEGRGVLVAGGLGLGDNPLYTAELYEPSSGTWSLQPDLPQEIDPTLPILMNLNGGAIALFRLSDKVFKQGKDGEWTEIEGVQLPIYYIDYSVTRAVLVPDAFSLGCL